MMFKSEVMSALLQKICPPSFPQHFKLITFRKEEVCSIRIQDSQKKKISQQGAGQLDY